MLEVMAMVESLIVKDIVIKAIIMMVMEDIKAMEATVIKAGMTEEDDTYHVECT